MKEVFIVVEGYTELEFIKSNLSPYLKERCSGNQIRIIPLPVATNANLGKKGGGKNYNHLKKELQKLTTKIENRIITTLIDYYGLPENFPNFENCLQETNVDEKILCLEQSIKNDVAPNNYNFFPYIQKHEFEALLFSSNKGFESYFSEIAKDTQKIINEYPNPEDINNNPKTAPSKRIKNIFKSYNKELYGNVLALEIGINTILEKCPRFKFWVETLISAIQS